MSISCHGLCVSCDPPKHVPMMDREKDIRRKCCNVDTRRNQTSVRDLG